MKNRCKWANTNDKLMQKYHDNEWGKPEHNNNRLFEILSLEMMQAGLSWSTILHKRKAFDKDFHNFNPEIVAKMANQVPKLLRDKNIIRNKRKILAIINNAKVIVKLRTESIDFNHYLWKFTNFKPIINHYATHADVPKYTKLSIKISNKMRKDGFKFVGKTIVYSFMEAVGIVNDHTLDCFLKN